MFRAKRNVGIFSLLGQGSVSKAPFFGTRKTELWKQKTTCCAGESALLQLTVKKSNDTMMKNFSAIHLLRSLHRLIQRL